MKLKPRDIVAFLIGVLAALSLCWLWSGNKSDYMTFDKRPNQVVAQQVIHNEDLPMMLNGKFYSPYLAIEDLLTDNFLDSLIRSDTNKEILDGMYGKPTSVTRMNDSEMVSYNLAVYDENLRRKGGRVGFVAILKNGTIIRWNPITQVNGGASPE